MDIAICDDQLGDVLRLQGMISAEHVVRTYQSAEALLVDVDELGLRFDLYFLDIILGEQDGIALAGRLRQLDERTLICFTSNSEAFYREAYDLYAFQYLLTPVEEARVRELLARAEDFLGYMRERFVLVETKGKTVSVPYDQILYIASRGHYIEYYCQGGVHYEGRGKLGELSAKLDGTVFCRTHQSYIVNLHNVDELDGNDFVCQGHRVPISRRYGEVKELYRQMLFREMT